MGAWNRNHNLHTPNDLPIPEMPGTSDSVVMELLLIFLLTLFMKSSRLQEFSRYLSRSGSQLRMVRDSWFDRCRVGEPVQGVVPQGRAASHATARRDPQEDLSLSGPPLSRWCRWIPYTERSRSSSVTGSSPSSGGLRGDAGSIRTGRPTTSCCAASAGRSRTSRGQVSMNWRPPARQVRGGGCPACKWKCTDSAAGAPRSARAERSVESTSRARRAARE